LLANFRVGYKFTDWLEYKLLYGVNYSVGDRRAEVLGWIRATGGNAPGNGEAGVFGNKLKSSTVTHTLNFTKDVSDKLSLSGVAGYEYWTTDYEGNGAYVYGFNYNLQQVVNPSTNLIHYYDNMNSGKQANLNYFSSKDPKVEIQSYFARATANWDDKYLLTATIRADGSNKFGSDNKYAYFPSVAAAWNIDHEDFMKDNNIFQTLKFRAGYGETGNQEFAADAALDVYRYNANGQSGAAHFGNPKLKWETVKSYNFGIDFSVLNNRVFGSIDYFHKKTTDPVILLVASQPQPPGSGGQIFSNINSASVENKGVEFVLGADVVKGTDLQWTVTANATFLKNTFDYPIAGTSPFILTGALHGQGTSGAFSQAIAHNQPINAYFLPIFKGFDKDGIGIYSETPEFAGDPNPSSYVGFSSDLTWKKWNLSIGMHGSFGNYLFNNTLMSVLNISNIVGGRNIASQLVNSGESVANPISTSSRFMEKGDYVKMHNATLKYTIGNVGRSLKNLNVYISGNNLFVISNYSGFDPEVNVDKALNGVPSLGIDYIGFPTQRTILLGVNFSL